MAMTQAMKHRASDEEGVYCEGRIGLGSRRLAIIDVVGGRQPIANDELFGSMENCAT